MSDLLHKSALSRFKESVSVSINNSLKYVKDKCVNTEEVVFKVAFTCDCLKSWQDFKNNNGLSISYIEILNAYLEEKCGLKVKPDCLRLEGRLRRFCSESQSQLRGKNGGTRQKIASKVRHMEVLRSELVDIREVENKLEVIKAENDKLEKENAMLHERCDQLYQELLEVEALGKKAEEKLEMTYVDQERLKKENAHLHQYLDKIEEQKKFENTGKKISEVKERQQRRKLRELKTAVEKSLWFAKTLGLDLSTASFIDDKGENYSVSYSSGGTPKSFQELPEDEQEKVKSVLFLTDKFCISDAAYHELTVTSGGQDLPRSYLIKQCKENLNQLCHITRTPGEADGAQLNLEEELKSRIQMQQSNNPTLQGKIRIKLSGDGAKMTRMTNFVVLSYSLLDTEDILSSKGNHTVAVVKGHESYNLLKTSCKDVFGYVNKLLDDGRITIDGKDIPVEILLGGDYKFLLLVLGMKGATSDFACIWCTCHKKQRHDMSKPMRHYWEKPFTRDIHSFAEWARHNKFACAHPPLVNILLENVILDELHLMLRITDNLLTNLVQEAIEWDKEENHNKPPSQRSTLHLNALVKAINSCGVCFNVWEKRNADGKGSGSYDFTSLMGSDKKLLLQHLPAKLKGAIKPETSDTVIKLWKSFDEIYQLINTDNPSEQQITEYFLKAKEWVETFVSLGSSCQGYTKEKVTPYMHSMVYHVPRMMTLHKGIKKFSGQGVEKKNDNCRRIHLQKSNKWDASKDVLLVLKRQERLASYERTPRLYTKHKADYWENEIREKRRKQLSVVQAEKSACETQIDMENMSPVDLKNKLKEMGIVTRARNIKNLQKMYTDALLAASKN